MPAKRKVTKRGVSAASEAGEQANDDSQGNDEAAGNHPASVGTTAGKALRNSTRTKGQTASQQTSVNAVMATATNTEVSLTTPMGTVVTPWDRERPGVPTQGYGSNNEIHNTGSNVI